jgi:DNA mismatch repair protein MutS2
VKTDGFIDDQTASSLGVAELREMLRPAGAYGDRVFDRQTPFVPGEESAARARAQSIAAAAAALDESALDAAREIFRNTPDVVGALARASMGDVLEDADFLELQRFFDACERLDAITAGRTRSPRVVRDAVVRAARALERGRSGRFGFYLGDEFDDELRSARAALSQAQAEHDAARGRERERVAAALGREISGNEFIVMRADLHGSLPPGVRVAREAPTYVLCELDAGEETLAALERRDEWANRVAIAEERVRKRLSDVVRTHAAALDDAARIFGELDVVVAAARFTRANACSVPDYEAQPTLAFSDGVFVPLAVQLEREGRNFTPIALRLDDVAVLTGPNMGGKSVCLRTCGLVALCAAFGIPVPARAASVAIFERIAWLGVGADGEVGGLLSTFAREVVRLREQLDGAPSRMLVLLDEFARTTTPAEGKALLVAVIDRLRTLGAIGLAATHLAGVARASGSRHYAVRGLRGIPKRPESGDLQSVLATLSASMDYTIEEITSDERRRSDAIALASLLGLDDDLTSAAHAAIEE